MIHGKKNSNLHADLGASESTLDRALQGFMKLALRDAERLALRFAAKRELEANLRPKTALVSLMF